MPFVSQTPEALLPRNDSKNPTTTCKGITTGGRPCRRAIASSKLLNNGVLTVLSVNSGNLASVAPLYCWQHKDQAQPVAAALTTANAYNGRGNVPIVALQHRNSIDTLVARLGVLEIADQAETTQKRARKHQKKLRDPDRIRPSRKSDRTSTWDAVAQSASRPPAYYSHPATQSVRTLSPPIDASPRTVGKQKPPKKTGLLAFFCFAADGEDDYMEVVRHKDRLRRREWTDHGNRRSETSHTAFDEDAQYAPAPASSTLPTLDASDRRKPLSEKQARPKNKHRPSSRSTELLSLIPKNLSPQVIALLLSELSKPISPHDEEGYIYIFWLTDTDSDPPSDTDAASLLGGQSRTASGRRPSDLVRDYATSSVNGSRDKKILLKIGRASNVHRRMNEWTRQCGYNLSLLRFYPHVPSSQPGTPDGTNRNPLPSPSPPRRPPLQLPRASGLGDWQPGGGVRKVPHAHRVERLIHIELSEQQAKQNCAVCCKEHREWYEVDANRESVRRLDEIIKRWVAWSERQEANVAG